MIQRFNYMGATEAYLIIDHNNHVYNYFTTWKETDMESSYIPVTLRAISDILEDVKRAGYTEAKYRIE